MSPDVFPGFSYISDEDLHDRGFMLAHGWRYSDVNAVFLEARGHPFGGEDVFAVVD